jgi:Uma2 family endonuclease
MTIEKTLLTADDLFRLPDDGMRHELVRGELRTMPPAGFNHGVIASELQWHVANFVRSRRLGYTPTADPGFVIAHGPDTVRVPDVVFVAAERIRGELPKSFADLAPDLVAEVVSPSDSAREVEEKVQDWLAAGVRLVWVVHPTTRSVTVYRSLQDIRILREADTLDGADVLPGFTCRVGDLFPAP